MRLEWQLEERHSDELGVLENSLNTLSRKLSATLDELQSANLQLQKDIEHQKALERAQQDFFSSASHELKTPITIIKGQLEGMLLGIGAYKDHEKYLARSLEVAATLETVSYTHLHWSSGICAGQGRRDECCGQCDPGGGT